jgi:hypothetical protein
MISVQFPFEVETPPPAGEAGQPDTGESPWDQTDQTPTERDMVVYDALTAIAVVGTSDMRSHRAVSQKPMPTVRDRHP